MRILFSPQVREEDRVYYEFSEDVVKVTLKGKTDTFDFRGFGDGELEVTDPGTGEHLIDSVLDENVVISAKRVNGVLYLELMNFIGFDATYEECFPEWIDHTEYTKPRVGESSG